MSNLQFNTKTAKEAIVVRRNYLQAGIHHNCNLVEYAIKATPNGNQFVSFTFEQDETKEVAELKIWYPQPERAIARDEETQEQAAQREVNRAIGALIHVVEVVTGAEMPTITATTFEGFATSTLAVLNKGKKNKVKVKQIYDKNGLYATFPNNTPYLELQSTEPTRLKFTKFEIENRLKKAVAPEATVDTSNATKTDDLPF